MGRYEWNDHMGDGWWVPMTIMMIVVVGGLVWFGVTLIKRGSGGSHLGTHASPALVTSPARPMPQEILAERLARGEIEPEEYRQRIATLKPPATN